MKLTRDCSQKSNVQSWWSSLFVSGSGIFRAGSNSGNLPGPPGRLLAIAQTRLRQKPHSSVALSTARKMDFVSVNDRDMALAVLWES